MKRGGQYQPLGVRMRDFGRSMMRHYIPKQQFPSPSETSRPIWQSDTETPLVWEETSLPAAEPASDQLLESSSVPHDPSAPLTPTQKPAPKAAEKTVQRESASPAPSPAQKNPSRFPASLLKLMENDQKRELQREQLRKAHLTKINEQLTDADPDTAANLKRRRGKMSVTYVDTKSLTHGEESVQRKPESPQNEATVSDDESNLDLANDSAVDQEDQQTGMDPEEQSTASLSNNDLTVKDADQTSPSGRVQSDSGLAETPVVESIQRSVSEAIESLTETVQLPTTTETEQGGEVSQDEQTTPESPATESFAFATETTTPKSVVQRDTQPTPATVILPFTPDPEATRISQPIVETGAQPIAPTITAESIQRVSEQAPSIAAPSVIQSESDLKQLPQTAINEPSTVELQTDSTQSALTLPRDTVADNTNLSDTSITLPITQEAFSESVAASPVNSIVPPMPAPEVTQRVLVDQSPNVKPNGHQETPAIVPNQPVHQIDHPAPVNLAGSLASAPTIQREVQAVNDTFLNEPLTPVINNVGESVKSGVSLVKETATPIPVVSNIATNETIESSANDLRLSPESLSQRSIDSSPVTEISAPTRSIQRALDSQLPHVEANPFQPEQSVDAPTSPPEIVPLVDNPSSFDHSEPLPTLSGTPQVLLESTSEITTTASAVTATTSAAPTIQRAPDSHLLPVEADALAETIEPPMNEVNAQQDALPTGDSLPAATTIITQRSAEEAIIPHDNSPLLSPSGTPTNNDVETAGITQLIPDASVISPTVSPITAVQQPAQVDSGFVTSTEIQPQNELSTPPISEIQLNDTTNVVTGEVSVQRETPPVFHNPEGQASEQNAALPTPIPDALDVPPINSVTSEASVQRETPPVFNTSEAQASEQNIPLPTPIPDALDVPPINTLPIQPSEQPVTPTPPASEAVQRALSNALPISEPSENLPEGEVSSRQTVNESPSVESVHAIESANSITADAPLIMVSPTSPELTQQSATTPAPKVEFTETPSIQEAISHTSPNVIERSPSATRIDSQTNALELGIEDESLTSFQNPAQPTTETAPLRPGENQVTLQRTPADSDSESSAASTATTTPVTVPASLKNALVQETAVDSTESLEFAYPAQTIAEQRAIETVQPQQTTDNANTEESHEVFWSNPDTPQRTENVVSETAQPQLSSADLPVLVPSSDAVVQRETSDLSAPMPIAEPFISSAAGEKNQRPSPEAIEPVTSPAEFSAIVPSQPVLSNAPMTYGNQAEANEVTSEPEGDDEAFEQGIDVFQALAAAGMISRSIDGIQRQPPANERDAFTEESSADQPVSSFPPESVDVYTALRAMGLVASKERASSKQAPPQRSQPVISTNGVTSSPIQREPLPGAIYEEEDEELDDEIEDYEDEDDHEDEDETDDELDIEKLARDVYRILKDRLRIESERGRNSY